MLPVAFRQYALLGRVVTIMPIEFKTTVLYGWWSRTVSQPKVRPATLAKTILDNLKLFDDFALTGNILRERKRFTITRDYLHSKEQMLPLVDSKYHRLIRGDSQQGDVGQGGQLLGHAGKRPGGDNLQGVSTDGQETNELMNFSYSEELIFTGAKFGQPEIKTGI